MHPPMSAASARAVLPRVLAVLGALALALAVLPSPATAQEDDAVTPARVDGQTRFHTAANIATATFEEATVAVLATGENYPDALAASYAAGIADGPVLLTNQASLPQPTAEALTALDVQSVVLIGGTGAISAEVESGLIDTGYEVIRHQGANRFETAAAVATAYGDGGPVGTLDGDRTAILASGENFPDALSAGPLAAEANLPLLLTPTGDAHATVTQALEALEIERIVVVGGTAAVSAAVVEHYAELGYEMERFSGRDRTETAITVAENAVERFGFSPETILLARGDDYPDALAASAHGGVLSAPILLAANPQVLSPATEGHLFDLCPAVERIRAIGGTGAISDAVLNEAVLAAGQCLDDAPDPGLGSWSELTDAPLETINHSAVWDGNELLIWGGGEAPTDAGAAHHAATDTWREIPAAPIDARWGHEAVWTGDHMVVYGGSAGADHLAECYDDGAVYDPTEDAWAALPANPHHDAGCGTAMVWTGDEVLVWGGSAGPAGSAEPVNSGAAYSPATNEWRPLPASPLGARSGHAAVWTGDRMIVFGGSDADFDHHSDAAAYDPATDEWTPIPEAPIAPRANPAVTWHGGGELVVVGGTVDGEPVSDGAAYDPVGGEWRTIPDLPGSHAQPIAVMSDIGLVLVVGGERDGEQPAAAGWDPTAHEWLPLADLPGEHRVNHTVTWADDRLLVFGGQDADGIAGGLAWHDE